MARNQASARPAERKDSSKLTNKKTIQSSAPRAPLPVPSSPKPEPVKRTGELPVPRATYFL